MKQTLFMRLDPDQAQFNALLQTMRRFNEACNHIASVAYTLRTSSRVKLQKETYREVREQFSLSAQMAVRAIGKVCEAYARDKSIQPKFKLYSAMVYDQRILSWKPLDRASMLTLKGRILVPIRVGEYQRRRMKNRVIRGQADLVLRNQKLYLAVVVDAPEESEYEPRGCLGVDLGIVNLAVDSDGEAYRERGVERAMLRMDRIKTRLQACGSKSARRHLKQLSGREARYRRDVNHVVSKRLVAKAKGTGRAIVLEDLKGIRAQTTVRKAQRRRHNSWSFNQLRGFIEYKARMVGVPVVFVNPRGTSHTCPRCGCEAKGNRPTRGRFECVNCGLTGPTDYIAALNIAARGAASRPTVPRNLSKPQAALRDKPPISIGGS